MLFLKRYICYCIFDGIVLKLEPSLFEKNAVSIGTGYPARSYKEKYVINNWQCLEGAVKHWEKGKERGEIPENSHGATYHRGKYVFLNTPDSNGDHKLNLQIPNQFLKCNAAFNLAHS